MRKCMTWATTPGHANLAFKKNEVLPLALPTTKVDGLSYARTYHGLPNFGLGAAGAQMILALQVLLNYDLSPCTCHLSCACFLETLGKSFCNGGISMQRATKAQADASPPHDVTLPHSACEGRRLILHVLRPRTKSDCRTQRVKLVVRFCICVTSSPRRTAALNV